ncbi:MAG: InlB B-repeat-containing protein [Fibrobacter sp.]|nr:InlB B-repeat-containing protein [Fibrobacter sp.]
MKKMVCAVLFAVMAVFSTAVFAEDVDPCTMPETLAEIDGVYQIGTCGDLYKFAEMVNGGETGINGRLTADICVNACGEGESVLKADGTLNGDGSNFTQWTPIGTDEKPYKGTFDGKDAEENAHVIRGLYFNDENADGVGLFGNIGEGAKVQNAGVVDSYILGKDAVGGVVGHNAGGFISNVYNTGAVSGGTYVGGVVGYNERFVSDVYNTSAVSGETYVGGVVGNNVGTVVNIYNTGAVSGGTYVGGVVGYNEENGKIYFAYYNTDFYTGSAVGEIGGGEVITAEGKPTAELIAISLGSAWVANNLVYDKTTGKLTLDFPCLKNPADFQYKITALEFKVVDNVIQIANADDLKDFARLVNEFGVTDVDAELTADIVVNENVLNADFTLNVADISKFTQWTSIGTGEKTYTGTFDGKDAEGNAHVISGLYFNDENADGVGLFGNIGDGAKVQNVGVVDSYVIGKNVVGGVVGSNVGGTVSNVYNTGSVSGKWLVGGVVGSNVGGTVSNVYNTGTVSEGSCVGGVVGYNNGDLSNVYNTGAVSGTDRVGGVVGNELYGTVKNAYYNTDFYAGNALGGNVSGSIENVEGKTTMELASTTLPEGFSSYTWSAGSGEQPVVSNGKLVYKLPGLKDVGSQPELVVFQENANGYYEISNAQELKWFAQLVNSDTSGINGRLTANICLNACGEGESVLKDDGTLNGDGSEFTQWTPIGTETKKFEGTFDGAGHTISGLYFNQDASYAGLFGRSTKGGSIKNVGVVDSYIKGMDHVGGIVGHNGNCTVSNVFSTSTVEGATSVGGIAGYNDAGTIVNAYNMGAVSGTNRVAGIAGQNDGTTAHINNVYSSGTISGTDYARGLVGYNNSYKKNIDNAYYNTDVFSGKAVGNVDGTNVEGKTSAEFADGTVVLLLRNWCEKSGGECKEDGLNGSVWGQNLAKENSMPDFSGEITGTLYPLTWVTYDDDTRTYPTEYIKELGLELPTDLTLEKHIFLGWSTKQIAESSADIVTSIEKGETGAKTFYAQWMKLDDAGCYEIASAFNLQSFAAIVNDGSGNVCGRLTANICLNACGEDKSVLNADGTLSADSAKFISWIPMIVKEGAQVSLNGGGHIIRGLYVNSPSVKNAGLFGSMEGYNIYRSLYIDSLGIEDSYIKGTKNAGAFVGNRGFAGMLTITNSHHKGVVVGSGNDNAHVGGLIGDADGNIRIENSFNSGSVIADNAYGSYAGGLIGRNYREAVQISNSYNVASISVKSKEWSYAGGLIAYRWDSQGGTKSKMTIVNSYNAGVINVLNEEITSIGGIVAYSDDVRNITNSFFLGLGENFGSIGKPAEAFKNGAVAAMLHNYKKNGVDGSVWGQGEDYPDFSGVIPETIKVHPLNLVTYDGQTLEYPSSYVEGDAFDLPRNPVRDGYVFAGWSSKEISESAEDRVASIGKDDSGDKTFYAQWIAPKNGCFEIGTTEALFGFAAAASNSEGKICGKLTKDIVINENVIDAKGSLSDNFSNFIQWTPIYVSSKMEENGSKRAEVTFDGNGHTIHGMYVKAEDDGSVGMFTGGGGVLSVSNLGIVDSYFGGKGSTGSIMGYCGGETISISNFYTAESVIGSGFEYVSGGFIGSSECDLTIRNSFNASPVKAGHTDDEYSVPGGALVAESRVGKFIENSFFIGEGDNFGAIGKPVEKFKNGVVATLLHNYKGNGVDGSIWGQKQDAELPDFSGKIFQTVKTSNLFLVMYDGRIFEGITAYVEGDAVELPVNLTREGYIFAGWSTKKISESAADMVTSIGKSDSGDKIFYAQWVAPADGCFEIATAEALYGFAAAVNKGDVEICGKLTADIVVNEGVLNEKGDLSGDSLSFVQWTPIGTDDNPYMGDFDGAGHTISGLYLNDMFREYVGLFGKDSTAKVRNVGVVDSYFNGSESIGGIVGSVIEGSVTNVYTSNIVVSGYYSVGGVIGYIEKTEFHNVSNLGTVRALYDSGGGVVGFVRGDVVVSNVYSVGKVGGVIDIGGMGDIGGVVGYSEGGIVSNSFFNKDLFDGDAVGSNNGGSVGDNVMGKTTAEFTADTLFAGLDPDVWSPGYFKTGAARDTMFYPYLKALGRGSYMLGDVKQYTITLSANDKAMGTVAGAGTYKYGTKVEISAAANEGYRFTDWEDDVKTATRTITVTKNETYTANFEVISSSSSEAKSSSSEAKSSSSEANSSSSQKESIIAQAQLPRFSVTASGKMVSIAGARPNTVVNVFDMQGNMVKTVVATAANFTFALPSAGVYIVKNGYTAKRVNVR